MTRIGSDYRKKEREHMMISCWHMNELESIAMWKIYAKANESVCIQSKYSKLATILPDDVYIGVVQYADYNKEWIPEGNSFSPFMFKRKSFMSMKEKLEL